MSTVDEAYIQKLLRTVNHDMSATLRSSVGFSSLILSEYDDRLDDQAKNWLRLNIEQGKKTQAGLIALSKYAKLYGVQEAASRCDLKALAAQACDELPLVGVEGMQIDIELVSSIKGYPLLWKDFFSQLLQNCVLHSGGAYCVISEQTDGAGFGIKVQDDGAGLDEEKVVEALLPYSAWGDQSGVGLGLSRAKRIAEIHGGRLKLYSTGRGLCVEACLPRDGLDTLHIIE